MLPTLFCERNRPKLKLHAAEAGGIQKRVRDSVRLKLKNHAAEASGIRRLISIRKTSSYQRLTARYRRRLRTLAVETLSH